MTLRRWFARSFIQHSRLVSYTTSVSVTEQKWRQKSENHGRYKLGVAAVLSSIVIGASGNTDKKDNKKKNDVSKHPTAVKAENVLVETAGTKLPNLPTYSAEEVSKHDSKSSFWVTYKHGVYDITEFLPSHPGGEQIYHAAGHSIEPFWSVYGMHKTEQIYELLETYRIGNLNDEDVVDHSDEEMWVDEPFRDKRLIVKTAKPFNAETPPKYQIEHFDTPNELFYVRQHMPVPALDAATYRVLVSAGGARHELSLQQLQQLPQASVRAALMCAGNRRREMDNEVKEKSVKGISWGGGAVSCAVWRGVYLRDVLQHCGLHDAGDAAGKHVIFVGHDVDASGAQFSTSVPLLMALDGVLLATHMNGAPLPRDHGAPLRVVLPGAPAVRSVKWLESIMISEEESPSHWHQKDYRSFNASQTWESADFAHAPPVHSLPVTSAICDPTDGDTVKVVDGCIQVRGYAYSGGGARVERVDVSADGGRSWREAALRTDAAPPPRHYAWALWTVSVPVPPHHAEVELWVKATDSNFNTQPEKFEHIWNIRGILSNAYHKIKVKLQH